MLRPTFLERIYPLHEVTWGPVLREHDWRRRTVRVVEASEGRFVMKVSEAGAPGGEETSSLVLDFLAEEGFGYAPTLLHTTRGGRSVDLEGHRIVLTELIEGTTPAPTLENHRALGCIMGKLNSMIGFPHDCPITLSGLRSEFSRITAHLSRRADRDALMRVSGELMDLDSLPRALIHLDMNLGNAISKPDGTMVIVDWDQAGTGARALDPGALLVRAFVSEDLIFDREGATEFFRAYRDFVNLSPAELEGIFDAAVMHAIRSVAWANAEARWRRVSWAIDHRDELMSVLG